jgi:hypothetical protein
MNQRDYPDSWRRPPMRGERAYYEPYQQPYWNRPEPYPPSERDREPDDYYSRDRGYRGDPGYRSEPRGLMERATDEMRSWFGDEDAEQRRRRDERSARGRWPEREPRHERDRDRNDLDERRWARQWGYIDPMEGRASWDRSRANAPYAPSNESSGVYPGVPSEAAGWSHGEAWAERGPFTGRGPRGFQRSDERIREEVCDRLWQHGGIDATDVEVTVKDAEVTLQGSVEDRGQRRVAEAMAESVWGVQQVQNLIRVGRGARGEEPGRVA